MKDKYVLVELDYPHDKSKLSEETLKQNAELKETYQPQGYPTILLADATGKPYAKTGYQAGGPEKYVTHLDELQKSKAARDEAIETASKSEGVDKAKALATLDAAKAIDPDSQLGSRVDGFKDHITKMQADSEAPKTEEAKDGE